MKLCRRCKIVEVKNNCLYCDHCKTLQRDESITNSYEYRKRKGLNKGAILDLQLGKPAKMEKYKPKAKPQIISNKEQDEIDAQVDKILDKGYEQDKGRSLSEAEIERLTHTITQIEDIRFHRSFVLHVNG
jgi:pimeloyl-CoA synthetase